VGDVLLSAGFMTFIGFFDYAYRQKLRETWYDIMQKFDLKLNPNLSFKEYLSKPQDRI